MTARLDPTAPAAPPGPGATSSAPDLGDPTRIGLWGPPQHGAAQGVERRAPRRPRPWTMWWTLWGLVGILASQILIIPVLVLMAIAVYDIDLNAPDATARLATAMEDIVLTGPGIVVAMLAQWAAFVGMPALATYRRGHRSLVKDFGLWFTRRDLPLGIALAVALQLLMAAISWGLHQTSLDLSGADNTNQVTDHTGMLLVFMVLAASIGAPLTEELFFRGLVLRSMLRTLAGVDHAPPLPGLTDRYQTQSPSPLRRRVGVTLSVLLSSVFFGVLHLQSLSGNVGHWIVVAQTGLLGLIFAVVAVKTRRIGLTVVAHLVFNSTSLTLVFLSGGA